MLHHIAIGTRNTKDLENFYLKIPNSQKTKEWIDEKGDTLRSVWIGFEGITLMLEEGEKKGPRALVFSFQESDRRKWELLLESTGISHHTDFTYYFQDPDGNTIGVSSYPERLHLNLNL
jgi:catechol 2,3-dioxygenase-like lactoylglutathione lyase family enzyme